MMVNYPFCHNVFNSINKNILSFKEIFPIFDLIFQSCYCRIDVFGKGLHACVEIHLGELGTRYPKFVFALVIVVCGALGQNTLPSFGLLNRVQHSCIVHVSADIL